MTSARMTSILAPLFPLPLLLPLALALGALAPTGCADNVRVTGQPCPCAASNVCCPSGLCAPNMASCTNASGAPTVPQGLTFVRQSATTGRFTWNAVTGATNYAVYVNGAQVKSTAETSVALDIGAGEVDVRVAALSDTGVSAKSGAFPVLFDVSLRACGSDNAEVRWSTAGETDTQLGIERASQNSISCVDPTPRGDHVFGDMASCTKTRLPGGTGGWLEPGEALTINMMSRDELGFLGRFKRQFTMPAQNCVCATSSKATDDDGCNPAVPTMMGISPPAFPPCAPGFDLETGTMVTDTSKADVFMEATEDANGSLTEARLVAPAGLILVKGKAICDILEAPASGYTQKVVIHNATPTQASSPLAERTDSFIVKTRSGRYAKLSLECSCPGGFLSSGTGIGALGMRFGWRVTAQGSTTFDD